MHCNGIAAYAHGVLLLHSVVNTVLYAATVQPLYLRYTSGVLPLHSHVKERIYAPG
jgi:hypothetical protein